MKSRFLKGISHHDDDRRSKDERKKNVEIKIRRHKNGRAGVGCLRTNR
jgi:hypothetical protein